MDYEGNLKKFFNKNKQEKQVEEKVWMSLELERDEVLQYGSGTNTY
jgi:hypothetical protein